MRHGKGLREGKQNWRGQLGILACCTGSGSIVLFPCGQNRPMKTNMLRVKSACLDKIEG